MFITSVSDVIEGCQSLYIRICTTTSYILLLVFILIRNDLCIKLNILYIR